MREIHEKTLKEYRNSDIEKAFDCQGSIDLSKKTKQEKMQLLHEFSDKNLSLEKCLNALDEAGLPSYTCCGGHEEKRHYGAGVAFFVRGERQEKQAMAIAERLIETELDMSIEFEERFGVLSCHISPRFTNRNEVFDIITKTLHNKEFSKNHSDDITLSRLPQRNYDNGCKIPTELFDRALNGEWGERAKSAVADAMRREDIPIGSSPRPPDWDFGTDNKGNIVLK